MEEEEKLLRRKGSGEILSSKGVMKPGSRGKKKNGGEERETIPSFRGERDSFRGGDGEEKRKGSTPSI